MASKALTARLVDEALDLLEHAKKASDHRTALAALREARDGLALLMRASGLLASDNSVTIDNRKLQVNLCGLHGPDLRVLIDHSKAPTALSTEVVD